MDAKVCQIYDAKAFTALLDGLEISPFMKLKQTIPESTTCVSGDIPIALADLNVADTLYCSFCSVGFTDKQQQRQHYKLDWHRYNLKLHLDQKKPISEDKFIQLADDVSSISGSDSETDDDSANDLTKPDDCAAEENRLSHIISRRSRILFNNAAGNVISLNRCLLLNKKEEPESYDYLVDLVKKLPNKSTWLIVMMGGGHFAAAIFKDGEPILHKTFHSYTVRAKQGGSQSAKDGKGTHAKSAGASMRRFNEQSHTQHVQDLFKTWGPEINKCDYIFYRAIGRSNSGVLFGGPNAPLQRSDPRVRTVPLTTRRPTFNELQRVYNLIATVFVYDSNEIFKTTFSTPPKPAKEVQEEFKKPSSPRRIDRAKERPSPDRKLPQIVQDLAAESSTDDTASIELITGVEEISFVDDLQEYGDSIKSDKSQNNKNNAKAKLKKKKKEKKPEDNFTPEVREFWSKVHGSCENDDSEALKQALESYSESVSKEELSMVLNQRNIDGQTVLHKMAFESKGDLVRLLMLHGCDPAVKDKKTQTPYDMCSEKTTRNIFRRFMGEFPDMYDYSKSHIPSALNEAIEAEILEKKRLLRKAKRQKEKEKKQQQEAAKIDEDDKKRFLALSDREKRALAAEKRLIAASGKTAVVVSRCFLCGADITGKVPFEYSTNRFCSINCLKAHRTGAKKQS